MDLNSLELAANVIFELCRQHPELCPHHYGWMSSIKRGDKTTIEHYKCRICGCENTKVVVDTTCPE